MRSPVPTLFGMSALGVVALAFFPPAVIGLGGVLMIAGAVVAGTGERPTGFGLAATGLALLVAAVLVLAVADVRQDEPVIIGPDRGLTPGTG